MREVELLRTAAAGIREEAYSLTSKRFPDVATALALADWLEAALAYRGDGSGEFRRALKVAKAYFGEADDA